jgi:hypothetical protein
VTNVFWERNVLEEIKYEISGERLLSERVFQWDSIWFIKMPKVAWFFGGAVHEL